MWYIVATIIDCETIVSKIVKNASIRSNLLVTRTQLAHKDKIWGVLSEFTLYSVSYIFYVVCVIINRVVRRRYHETMGEFAPRSVTVYNTKLITGCYGFFQIPLICIKPTVRTWIYVCYKISMCPHWRQCHDIIELLNHDDVIKWKHFPRYWPFVRGFHRSSVNSPHKGQWRGALKKYVRCI